MDASIICLKKVQDVGLYLVSQGEGSAMEWMMDDEVMARCGRVLEASEADKTWEFLMSLKPKR